MKRIKFASMLLAVSFLLASSVSSGQDASPPGKESTTIVKEMKQTTFVTATTLAVAELTTPPVCYTAVIPVRLNPYTTETSIATSWDVSGYTNGIKGSMYATVKIDKPYKMWGYSMADWRLPPKL